jgi:hypothetical protein
MRIGLINQLNASPDSDRTPPTVAKVRCDVWPKTPTAIEAMTSVVEMVHAN